MKFPLCQIITVIIAVFSMSGYAAQSNSGTDKAALSEINRWKSVVPQLITKKSNWPDEFKGKVCTLHIHLNLNGNVEEVRSSGDTKLCEHTEMAIREIGVFPLSKDKEIADKLKHIKLTVAP